MKRVSTRTKLDPAISQAVIEAFFEIVRDSLTEGNPIFVRQFGSFILKQRAKKTARNLSTNTAVTVPAHVILAFKPSQAFVGQVRAREKTVPEF